MRALLLLAALSALPACAGLDIGFQDQTARALGARPQDIRLSNMSSEDGDTTYTAWSGGRPHTCTADNDHFSIFFLLGMNGAPACD